MAPRDPSNCRGWMRLSCGPAFQQTVRTAVSTTTKVDVPSGAYRSPVRCDAVRFSIGSDDRERPRQAAARRLSYNRSKSNGREGTGIGNASRYPAVWC